MDVVMWGREAIGGPFALIDHNGQRRTDADFRDKLLLIYFGFTACSDACPTDLQAIAGAVDKLGPMGEAVQPLFITINPELDTPEQLKSYVALFHPRMIGLTGDRKQIREVTRAYKVYFARTTPTIRTDPSFDHSSVVYLVDIDGSYIGFFPPGTPADRMVEVLRPRLAAPTHRRPSRMSLQNLRLRIRVMTAIFAFEIGRPVPISTSARLVSTAERPRVRGTGLMERWLTLAHFSVSSPTNLPKSAGEPTSTVPPPSARRLLGSGSERTALISLLSLSMISAGVA